MCVTSRTALIFVGNSYENSKEINVTISVDDKVLYNGFLKAYAVGKEENEGRLLQGFCEM